MQQYDCEARLRRFHFFMNGINFKSGSASGVLSEMCTDGWLPAPGLPIQFEVEAVSPASQPASVIERKSCHPPPPPSCEPPPTTHNTRGFKAINSFIPEEEEEVEEVEEENKLRSSWPGRHRHTQTISVIVTISNDSLRLRIINPNY